MPLSDTALTRWSTWRGENKFPDLSVVIARTIRRDINWVSCTENGDHELLSDNRNDHQPVRMHLRSAS